MKNEKAFVLMKHGGLLIKSHGNAWDLNMRILESLAVQGICWEIQGT
jgi:hypothetical protein